MNLEQLFRNQQALMKGLLLFMQGVRAKGDLDHDRAARLFDDAEKALINRAALPVPLLLKDAAEGSAADPDKVLGRTVQVRGDVTRQEYEVVALTVTAWADFTLGIVPKHGGEARVVDLGKVVFL